MARRNEPEAKPTPINGADIDHGLGEYFEQFDQPRKVGDLTVMEASDIKARNAVLERLNKDIEHLMRTRVIVSNEKVAFIRSIGERFGLDARDELTVNDDTGAVLHNGRRKFMQPPEPEPEPEPVLEAQAPITDDAATPPVN